MVTDRPEGGGRKQRAKSTKEPESQRLVYSVPKAGRLLGLGRNAAYDAAKRGDIPTIRIGRLLRVPKGPFHKLLGAEVRPHDGDQVLGNEQPAKEPE
ncbi:helix-turn-helix domain-containing protein [Bradyrhizobium sp.]|uniref:helix-turn-helix domain-containing protein n=1 Tax=Bradyrhizobium sp. TaxID=376 RepID=UPI003C700133